MSHRIDPPDDEDGPMVDEACFLCGAEARELVARSPISGRWLCRRCELLAPPEEEW